MKVGNLTFCRVQLHKFIYEGDWADAVQPHSQVFYIVGLGMKLCMALHFQGFQCVCVCAMHGHYPSLPCHMHSESVASLQPLQPR